MYTRNFKLQFATRFFQWAHTHCPSLKVFVWGTYKDVDIHDCESIDAFVRGRNGHVGSSERGQQQCFVKEIRELDDGTLQVTAARSTRSEIRNDFPELHILDYDTGHYLADRLADEAVR